MFVTFIAVALMSPRLVRPMASVLGRPAQRFAGFPGRLARENAMRQPGRTAATAAALMVGVTLVTFASIFAAGAKATIDDAITDNLKAELVVQNTDGFSPFSGRVLPAVAQVDGVAAVSAVRFSKAKLTGLRRRRRTSPASIRRRSRRCTRSKVEEGPQDAIRGARRRRDAGREEVVRRGPEARRRRDA